MGWFSSSPTEEKSTLARNPVNLDVTKQYGSGAEQDRYGQHFANAGAAVGEKVKEGIQELTSSRGSGAEQDRYDAKFGVKGGPDRVREAARSGYEQSKQAASQGYGQAKNAAERGYDQAKDAAERGYGQAKNAAEKGYEQAKDAAERGYDRAKDALDKAVRAKGDGAEQDRYGAHFDYSSLDLTPVTKAALSIIGKGGDLSAASRHGLGHDGWQRAKYLAAYKGSGAEQDRYEARFATFGQHAAQAIKDKVNEIKG